MEPSTGTAAFTLPTPAQQDNDKQLTSPQPQHTQDVQHAETTVHVAKQSLKRRASRKSSGHLNFMKSYYYELICHFGTLPASTVGFHNNKQLLSISLQDSCVRRLY